MQIIKNKVNSSEFEYQLLDDNGKLCSSLMTCGENKHIKEQFYPCYKDKKILQVFRLITENRKRNKGHATTLLNYVLEKNKNKYDYIHVNVCPFSYHKNRQNEITVKYKPYKTSLTFKQLIDFYKKLGFKRQGVGYEPNGGYFYHVMLLDLKK